MATEEQRFHAGLLSGKAKPCTADTLFTALDGTCIYFWERQVRSNILTWQIIQNKQMLVFEMIKLVIYTIVLMTISLFLSMMTVVMSWMEDDSDDSTDVLDGR